ncbi:MAG: hypothetical protein ACHQFX_19060 [Chitinophagales bacterium]
MKKLFIGLLIIAAGAGAYFFLQKKKSATTDKLDKELLVGKWKMDSLNLSPRDSATAFVLGLMSPGDSTLSKSQFDFQEGGTFLQTHSDPLQNDTSYYEWSKKNKLLIKESIKDSTGEVYFVNILNIDSLILQSKDSTVFVLTKIK